MSIPPAPKCLALGVMATLVLMISAVVGLRPAVALGQSNFNEAGGLRYTIRGSSSGAPRVEVFDVGAATVEKIRFLE